MQGLITAEQGKSLSSFVVSSHLHVAEVEGLLRRVRAPRAVHIGEALFLGGRAHACRCAHSQQAGRDEDTQSLCSTAATGGHDGQPSVERVALASVCAVPTTVRQLCRQDQLAGMPHVTAHVITVTTAWSVALWAALRNEQSIGSLTDFHAVTWQTTTVTGHAPACRISMTGGWGLKPDCLWLMTQIRLPS